VPVDTRRRILDVAEGLFAADGFAATSLRDITAAARVNLAAVNYHFGSKEALLAAVLERRVAPINAVRLQMLDEAEAKAGRHPVDLEELLRALLAPPFRYPAEPNERRRFLQLTGRLSSMPHERVRVIVHDQFEEVTRRFVPAFRKALPHLDEEEVGWRIFLVIGAMLHTMTWCGVVETFDGRQRDSEEMLETLVAFAHRGMLAPARSAARVQA